MFNQKLACLENPTQFVLIKQLYIQFIVTKINILLQLEVVEMLVHNGADLNARTKHDETPAGMKLNSLLLNIFIKFVFHQDLFM